MIILPTPNAHKTFSNFQIFKLTLDFHFRGNDSKADLLDRLEEI